MRSVLLVATILALAVSSAVSKDRGLPPAEERAKAQFAKAAFDAEAAYRETVIGMLKALGSRLVDLERAAVRERDIKEGNRIRYYRDLVARLAAEVGRHDFLAGVLPPIGLNWEPPTAKSLIEKAAGELSEAEGAYAAELRDAEKDVGELLTTAMRLATDSADLDAANRVGAVADGIASEIATRLEPLSYTEYKFSSIHHSKSVFLFETPEAWRVQDGELIGSARERENLEATLERKYKRISAVTVRGRILSKSNHNFRMTVGPVNLILNWERAAECHFRYHEKRSVVRGHLLQPGREHEITVRQLTEQSIEVCIDGKRVWITHGQLFGTITVYPSWSTIGVREIRVLAVEEDRAAFDGPSHRRW